MQLQSLFSASEEAMKKTIEKVKTDLASVRTGRASAAIVESIKIDRDRKSVV